MIRHYDMATGEPIGEHAEPAQAETGHWAEAQTGLRLLSLEEARHTRPSHSREIPLDLLAVDLDGFLRSQD